MKEFKLFFTLSLLLTINYAFAQMCTQDDSFTNSDYFLNTQIDSLKNVTYGNANNYLGELQDLKMDIYFPNNTLDTMVKRPFILLIHGGGFYKGKREDMSIHSNEFARRGFVVATMSYRLGINDSINQGIIKALYRAQQDANSALRYVIENADKLKIDTSWIFLGGSSAGAMTSMLTTYASPEEWAQVNPQIESDLGSLDSSGNELKQTFEIKGIYNHVGAVHPIVLDLEDLIPMVSFHGELDQTAPIDKSNNGFGSRAIHNMLNEAEVCNDLTIVPDGTHGIFNSYEGITFRVNRVACFFKSLMCDTCVDFVASENVPAVCSD